MINKLKKNYLYLLEFIVLFVLAIFPIAYNTVVKGLSISLTITSVIIILVIALFFYFFLSKKDSFKPEKLFLLIILVVGPFYLFLFPLNQIPDEFSHAGRIYEIAGGNLVSEKISDTVVGRELDSAIYPVLINNKNYNAYFEKINTIETKKDMVYQFNNTSLYSFVCYIPQVTGVLVSNIFTDKIMIQLLFARLFNFLVYAFLMYWAIKLLPLKKELMFIVGLLPLSIQEAVSLSPDSLTIATSALLISFIFYLRSEKIKVINIKHIIILALLTLFVSQCKIVYLPLCLLLFLIPGSKFNTVKQKYLILISMIVVISLISVIWLKIAGSYLPDGVGGIDSNKQLSNIISNPFKYLYVVLATMNFSFIDYIFEAFGSSLSNLNIAISKIFITINIVLFILLSVVNYKEKEKVNQLTKWFIGGVIIIITMLICTSLYLQWTPVDDSLIKGIQGRYFIPLLFISGLLLFNKKINTKVNLFNRYFILFIIMEQFCVLSSVFYFFI